MIFNFDKLLGRIKEKYKTNAAFCVKLKMSEKSFSEKINNKKDFKSREVVKMQQLLEISKEEIPIFFYNYEVQNFEQK